MRSDRAAYSPAELLYRGLCTLLTGMVTVNLDSGPDFDHDLNPAIASVECHPVEGDPDRVALQDAENPLAWIESDISFPVGAVDGHEEFSTPAENLREPAQTYNASDR